MITSQKSEERRHDFRGTAEVWHSLRPAERHETGWGYGALEAFDESCLAPAAKLTHEMACDVEVISYIQQGAVRVMDAAGRSVVVCAGEFHHMTAVAGEQETQRNASRVDEARLFRITLRLSEPAREASREHKRFSAAERRGGLCVIASPDARRGSLRVQQDALICSAIVGPGWHVVHELAWRSAWIHLVRGEVTVGGVVLRTGDGMGLCAERVISLTAREESELLLVDVGGAHESMLALRESSESTGAMRLGDDGEPFDGLTRKNPRGTPRGERAWQADGLQGSRKEMDSNVGSPLCTVGETR